MDVNQLKIGNFLHFPFIGRTVKVVGINANENSEGIYHTISFEKDGNLYCEPVSVLNPISITEDWLIKLGFEEVYRSKFRFKYDCIDNPVFGFDFNLTGQDNGMQGLRYYGRYINVDYVHEVQNVYFSIERQELKQQL